MKYIQQSYASSKWSANSLAVLPDLTRKQRQKWIVQDCPKVFEVVEVFPCLREYKLVSIVYHCRNDAYVFVW